MGWRRVRVIGACCIAAAAGLGVVVFGQDQASPAKKLPFTVSAETTVVTYPLRADGTPDYVAAINEKYGKGVTPENNGFAALLEVLGTDKQSGTLPELTRARALEILGIKETPAGQATWKFLPEFLQGKGVDADRSSQEAMHFSDLAKAGWKKTDEPAAADYLDAMDALLNEVQAAAAKPKWWMPEMTSGAPEDGTLVAVLLPALGATRALTESLDVRATRRIGEGDFDGFLADVQAAKLIGRHETDQPTLIEGLIGIAISTQADGAIAAAVDSGKLTGAQCASILKMVDALPKAGSVAVAIDRLERWEMLEMAERTAMGQSGKLFGDAGDPLSAALNSIDAPKVDWDVVLRQFNRQFDEIKVVAGAPDVATALAKAQAIDRQVKAQGPADERHVNLSPRDGESREQYSMRVAWGLESVDLPSFERPGQMGMRGAMSEEMARMLLAAAEVKAKTGKWPERGEDLVPGEMKELPRDIYSDGGKGTEAIKYIMTQAGPKVYSVGENGRDDGGVRGDGGEDDIALGGFDAGREKAPDAEMP